MDITTLRLHYNLVSTHQHTPAKPLCFNVVEPPEGALCSYTGKING